MRTLGSAQNLSLFEILVIDHDSEPTKQSGIQNNADKNNLKHADMLKKSEVTIILMIKRKKRTATTLDMM